MTSGEGRILRPRRSFVDFMSPEEELALIPAAKAGIPWARAVFVRRFFPLILGFCKRVPGWKWDYRYHVVFDAFTARWHGLPADFDPWFRKSSGLAYWSGARRQGKDVEIQLTERPDWLAAAISGFLRAIDEFDPAKGCRLATVARYWIGKELNEVIADATYRGKKDESDLGRLVRRLWAHKSPPKNEGYHVEDALLAHEIAVRAGCSFQDAVDAISREAMARTNWPCFEDRDRPGQENDAWAAAGLVDRFQTHQTLDRCWWKLWNMVAEQDRQAERRLHRIGRPAYALELVGKDRAKNPPSVVDWIAEASANGASLDIIHYGPAGVRPVLRRHRRRKILQHRSIYPDFKDLEPLIVEVLESGEIQPTMNHDKTFEAAYRLVKSRVSLVELHVA